MLDKNSPDFMKYNKMFVELWSIFKRFYTPDISSTEEEDVWWLEWMATYNKFVVDYKDIPLAHALIECLSRELERKFRVMKEDAM